MDDQIREAQQLLQESAALLEQMQDTDRERARRRLKSTPSSLSDYERKLLQLEEPPRLRRMVSLPNPHAAVAGALCPKGIVFRTPLLQQLNDHVIALAIEHDIKVTRVAEDEKALASNEDRRIFAPAPTCEGAYAVCLHEMGHIVSPDGDSRQYEHYVKTFGGHRTLIAPGGEVGAWRWAVKSALVWTLAMQERLYRSLSSYAHEATFDEKFDMAWCVQTACLRVTGPPTWTFDELAAKCASLRG